MGHRPPFETLAFPNFKRTFGDLLSVRAEVTEYEYTFVTSIYSQLFFFRLEPGDTDRWRKTVRAAHYYLDHGALKNTRTVCEAYMRIADQLPRAMNNAHDFEQAVKDAKPGDARVRALLAYYKALYEGVMTVAAAPIVVGFSLVYNTNKAKEFVPKPDGRVDLRAIEKMQQWSASPSFRLKHGLNAHVRNAYSHERYRLLDLERVEMWDEDRRGRRTWGPETWDGEKVEALCDQLHLTILAAALALTIFGINYRRLISARGWIPADVQRVPLRQGDIHQLATRICEDNSFALSECRRDGDTLHLGLRTQLRGVDQEEEIIVGGDGWGEHYKKPVRYEEVSVAEYAVGVLQRVAHQAEDAQRFRAAVSDENGGPIGELVATRSALYAMRGRSGAGIGTDRRLAELDTLGDAKMWLRVEGEVVRVGGGRTRPTGPKIVVP